MHARTHTRMRSRTRVCTCAHMRIHIFLPDTPFRKISSGTCATSGAMPIKSASLCTKAAAALGLPVLASDYRPIRTTAKGRPEGCYWFKSAELPTGKVWMSTGNVGNGYNDGREPICTTRTTTIGVPTTSRCLSVFSSTPSLGGWEAHIGLPRVGARC